MAPVTKLRTPLRTQSTRQKTDKLSALKPNKTSRLNSHSEGKEDKSKNKGKENEQKSSSHKKLSATNYVLLATKQNSDTKSIRSKLINNICKPKQVKLSPVKLLQAKPTPVNDSKPDKNRATPSIKYLTVQPHLKKPVKENQAVKDDNLKVITLSAPTKPPIALYKSVAVSTTEIKLPGKVITSNHRFPHNLMLSTIPENKHNRLEFPDEVPEEHRKLLTTEEKMKLAVLITKTIQHKKIFAMSVPYFGAIRNALQKRGWIQKFACEEQSLKTGIMPSDPEGQFTQRMLRNVPINFVWVFAVHDWNEIKTQTLVNRFPRAVTNYSFTSKIGLNQYLQQAYWYNEEGVAEVSFPRTYSILSQDDITGFTEDYVMTACMCLLKLVVMIIVQAEHNIFKDGDIPLEIIDFAINRCREYVAFKEHRDIDKKEALFKNITQDEPNIKWFLSCFYRLVHDGAKFQYASYLQTQGIYLSAKSVLQDIQRYWPELKLDGLKNLWVLKQSNLNCGRGVRLFTTLDSILNSLGEVKTRPRFVIQKYIERPLLIYDTKFDIRQWILLTGVNPLQIWMYDECYLRFSSQVFSLSDISESIHLCNNVIQKKYRNAKRHASLPSDNMWDSTRFRAYLEEIGEGDKWEKVIYPGMKKNIIATIMAAQESMIERTNSFELYGVDFMLTEDFKPWLIEVNSSPAMSATTSVTGRMCNQCLQDIIKVVVDRRNNALADTGHFKLIYKQDSPSQTRTVPLGFEISGKRIVLMAKNVPLLAMYTNKNPVKTPSVVELENTPAGKDLMMTDASHPYLLDIVDSKDLMNEFKFVNTHFRNWGKGILKVTTEKQSHGSKAERVRLRHSDTGFIKNNTKEGACKASKERINKNYALGECKSPFKSATDISSPTPGRLNVITENQSEDSKVEEVRSPKSVTGFIANNAHDDLCRIENENSQDTMVNNYGYDECKSSFDSDKHSPPFPGRLNVNTERQSVVCIEKVESPKSVTRFNEKNTQEDSCQIENKTSKDSMDKNDGYDEFKSSLESANISSPLQGVVNDECKSSFEGENVSSSLPGRLNVITEKQSKGPVAGKVESPEEFCQIENETSKDMLDKDYGYDECKSSFESENISFPPQECFNVINERQRDDSKVEDVESPQSVTKFIKDDILEHFIHFKNETSMHKNSKLNYAIESSIESVNIPKAESETNGQSDYDVINSWFSEEARGTFVNRKNRTEILNENPEISQELTENEMNEQLTERKLQAAEKSPGINYTFENLPISKVIHFVNHRLHTMSHDSEGMKPVKYKIYYSKAKSRFIVDVEDAKKRYR